MGGCDHFSNQDGNERSRGSGQVDKDSQAGGPCPKPLRTLQPDCAGETPGQRRVHPSSAGQFAPRPRVFLLLLAQSWPLLLSLSRMHPRAHLSFIAPLTFSMTFSSAILPTSAFNRKLGMQKSLYACQQSHHWAVAYLDPEA